MQITTSRPSLKFKGISVFTNGEPEIWIQGRKTKDPYGPKALNINSAVVFNSEKTGQLVDDLESGNSLTPESVRDRLLDILQDDAGMDFSVQTEHKQPPDFNKAMKDYFFEGRDFLVNMIRTIPIVLKPQSETAKEYDVLASINSDL
ncbi:MAG TPA: hypothetical protein V6C52_07660 [Coleofasciculaceae cyanobacterium]